MIASRLIVRRTLYVFVIVPLVVLAGLFIWLKLTEEADEEALELEQDLELGETV